MSRGACCLLFTSLLISLHIATFAQDVVQLSPYCHNPTKVNESCVTLNTVLISITSNTTLSLQPGVHLISNYSWAIDLTDLSIIGNSSDPSNVVIECEPSFGLIFMSIERLTFRGLTLRDCGFNGTKNVNTTFSYIERFIVLFYDPLSDFSTGLFMAHITDLTMEDMVVDSNEGFGVVGINIIGKSRISNVNFTRNRPKECILELEQISSPGGSGGAMFLLYQDYIDDLENLTRINYTYNLLIENVQVRENYNCRIDLFSEQHNLLSRSLEPRLIQNVSFIGAGGVTISLAQSSYTVYANVTDSLFSNNFGTYHGSALEVSHFELTSDSHIYITNTNFLDNGIILEMLDGPLQTNGLNPAGALIAAFYLPVPSNSAYSDTLLSTIISQLESSVDVLNCTFQRNIAQSGSGIQVFSLGPTVTGIQDRITIQDCLFENNTGDYGSAVFVTEISYSAFEPGLRVIFDSITAIGNRRILTFSVQSGTTGVIDINFINVTLNGTNQFCSNKQTAISVYSGILVISGSTNFSKNVGINGGALSLDAESYLVLAGDRADVRFTENTAQMNGGGIYVNFDTIRTNDYDCFLFIDDVDIFCNVQNKCPDPKGRFSLTFINNTAQFGAAIYGSSFSRCPWINVNNSGLVYLALNGSITNVSNSSLPIIFDPPFTNPGNTINTVAERIKVDYVYNNTIMNDDNTIHLYPGQNFTLSLGSFDKLNQSVPLTVLSQLQTITENDAAHSQIGGSDRYLLSGGESNTYTTVPLLVFAEQNTSYEMTITSAEEHVETFTARVFLHFCPGGFNFNNNSQGCDCNVTDLEQVECNEDGTLSYRIDFWLGMNKEFGYIQKQCIFDYCIPGLSILNLSESDSQCRNNRAGILCGGCAKNYSRKIGTSSCDQCDSYISLLWILFFAVLGIGLFAYLAVLNVTITDGFINGFIFYSNICNVYLTSFSPSLPDDARQVPEKIIAFLNLDFGIPICFYPGMTELALAGLRFIFPVYLLLLLLIFFLCAKYISNQKVANFCQKINVTHIFATLILLSYTSLLQTCFAVLGSTTIDNNLRWAVDPNVLYEDPAHVFLAVLSACILVVLIPFPLLLLFPRVVYRTSYLQNSKPLIDAFIAPLAPGREFWVGVRMIFRIVFFLIALSSDTAVVVALSVLIAILTVVETNLQPFNNGTRNFINRMLMMNLTIFSITAIHTYLESLVTPGKERSFNTINLYVFLLMFAILNSHYLLIRFKCTRDPYEKVIKFFKHKFYTLKAKVSSPSKKRKQVKKKIEIKKDDVITHASIELSVRQETNFEETDFIAYREELMDTGDFVDFSSSSNEPSAENGT